MNAGEEICLRDSMLEVPGMGRKLAALEVSVEDYSAIIEKKIIPLVQGHGIRMDDCLQKKLNLSDDVSLTNDDCQRNLLKNGFKWAKIFSGTLQNVYFNDDFFRAVMEGYEKGVSDGGKSYLGVHAGPYIDGGGDNKFVRKIQQWQADGKHIEFFLSKNRLPVHGLLCDKGFIYEEVHAEFIRERTRWLIPEIPELIIAIATILDADQGKYAGNYCANGLNAFKSIRLLPQEGIAGFESPVKMAGLDEMFSPDKVRAMLLAK